MPAACFTIGYMHVSDGVCAADVAAGIQSDAVRDDSVTRQRVCDLHQLRRRSARRRQLQLEWLELRTHNAASHQARQQSKTSTCCRHSADTILAGCARSQSVIDVL
jgi:hypothetical protein